MKFDGHFHFSIYLLDAFFAADICRCFLQQYFHAGELVSQLRRVAHHYMSTYFFIDLISVLPINYFGKQFGNDRADGGQSVQSLRLLRVLRLSKLTKV